MNVFICDSNPIICAQSLDDRRLVKMCLETTQIASTINRLYGFDNGYKSTHIKHPIIQHYKNNYKVIVDLGHAYFSEYTKRFERIHKSQDVFNNLELLKLVKENIEPYNLAANRQLNIDYTDISNTYDAYKLYLLHRWLTDSKLPRWNKIELDPKNIFKINLTQLKI